MGMQMINGLLRQTKVWWIGAIMIAALCITHVAYAQSPNEASGIYFSDSYIAVGEVQGMISFMPAADQSTFTDYAIYFTDEQGKKLQKIGIVNVKAEEEKMANAKNAGMLFGRNYYQIKVENTSLPSGARKIGIFTMNGSIESDVGAFCYFLDYPDTYIANIDFKDTNPELSKVEGTLRWDETAGHPEVKGYSISYVDGLGKLHPISGLPELYKSGKGKYEVPIPLKALPSGAFAIRIQVAVQGEDGYVPQSYSVQVIDDISGDTKGIDVTTKGVPKPTKVNFVDSDQAYGTISGVIYWNSDDESFLKQSSSSELGTIKYSLYFLDAADRKIKGIFSVSAYVDTYGEYRLRMPEGTIVPPNARSIGVFVQMQTAEGVNFSKIELRDSNGKDHYAKNVQFVDEDPKVGSIHGKMKWSASDGEEDLKGYALFSGEEKNPFLVVKKAGPNYEAKVPDSIIASNPGGIRILPVAVNDQFLHSNDPANEGNFLITDSYAMKMDITPGTMGDYDTRDYFNFRDDDNRPGFIGGVVQISFKVQANEGSREIYFYDRKGQRIASIGKVHFNSSKAGDELTFTVPLGTPIPKGAVYVGSSFSDGNGNTKDYGVAFTDNSDSVKVKFSDIPTLDDSSIHLEIRLLAQSGIITGFNDNTFRPNASVTRAQFTAMIMRSFRIETKVYKGTFKDVSVDDWYSGIIATGVASGLLTGYEDGTVRPNQVITRKEMYSIVYRILEWRHNFDNVTKKGDGSEYVRDQYTDGKTIPDWLFNAIYVLNYYKLTPTDKTIDLDKQVSRAECAGMIYNLMKTIY